MAKKQNIKNDNKNGSNTIAEKFKMLTKEEKKEDRKKLYAFLKQFKGYLILLVLTTAIVAVQASAFPKIIQIIMDNYLNKEVTDPITGVVTSVKIVSTEIQIVIGLILALAGLVIIKSVATWISSYNMRKFQQAVDMTLKEKIYSKFLKVNVEYFDNKNEGYFVSRVVNDSNVVGEFCKSIPENLINIVIAVSFNFSLIFTFSWIIGLVSIGIFAILLVFSFLMRKKFIDNWSVIKAKDDRYISFIQNTFSGIREIKIANKENDELNQYKDLASDYMKTWRHNFKLYGIWMVFNTFVLDMLPVGMVAIAVWQTIEGNMTAGVLTALLMYAGMIKEPINRALAVVDTLMRGSVSVHRIFEVLAFDEEQYEGKQLTAKSGAIEFKNVSLKYSQSNQHVLRGVSFKINPGEKVAFVGNTGAGKSTIFKALLRFYKTDKGKIYVDGKDISKYSVDSLRRNFSYMAQEPHLSFDTIKENIIFGRKNITSTQMWQSIKDAQAGGFIKKLDNQEKSMVGPRGVTLSGGQKQRLALSRMFVDLKDIVLLDEATSALDNNTESDVQKAIYEAGKGKTILIIAHRLSTIKDVDRIIVMDKGKIAEEGSWKELMKKKGIFFNLAKNI